MFNTMSTTSFQLSKVSPYARGKAVYIGSAEGRNGNFEFQCAQYSQGLRCPFDPQKWYDDSAPQVEWQSIKLSTVDTQLVQWILAFEANVKHKLVEDKVCLQGTNTPFTKEALDSCWSSTVKHNAYDGSDILRCKWHAVAENSATTVDLCCTSPINGEVTVRPGTYLDLKQGHTVIPVFRAKCAWYVSGKCGIRFDLKYIMIKDYRAEGDNCRPGLFAWDGPPIHEQEVEQAEAEPQPKRRCVRTEEDVELPEDLPTSAV